MTMRCVSLFAAALLSSCTSMTAANSDQTARLQPTAYQLADDATSATGNMATESKPVRIFWFLGGR
jgi:geranylgeranyl pyrophosphate synthase